MTAGTGTSCPQKDAKQKLPGVALNQSQRPNPLQRRSRKDRPVTAACGHGPFRGWHSAAFTIPGSGPVKGGCLVWKDHAAKV